MYLELFDRYRDIIDDWDAFAQAHERTLPTTLWTNTLRLRPDELEAFLGRDGVELEPLSWYPGGFRWTADRSPGKTLGHVLGLFHIQEEVSMMPIHFLDPLPGESVLDLCAAPGNKTIQAAVRMEDRGRVIAIELNVRRLKMIAGSVERLGLSNIAVLNQDAGNLPRDFGLFDRVLADVPCNCEGTARKHPEVLVRHFAPGFKQNAQLAILRKAIKLAKPGGRIVYSTCTYAPEENEWVVDEALRSSPEGSLRIVEAHLPGIVTRPGLTEWDGRAFVPELTRAMRIYPHLNDTGGFFLAVLEKAPDASCDPPAPSRKVPGSVDSRTYLDDLVGRFGMPSDVLDGEGVFRTSSSRVSIASDDLHLPAGPPSWSVGLPFYRTKTRQPRLSSAAAMRFGRQATKNIVDLDEPQVLALIGDRELALERSHLTDCDGPGHVLLCYRGFALTVGFLRFEDELPIVRGPIPKIWSRVLDPSDDPPDRLGGEDQRPR